MEGRGSSFDDSPSYFFRFLFLLVYIHAKFRLLFSLVFYFPPSHSIF